MDTATHRALANAHAAACEAMRRERAEALAARMARPDWRPLEQTDISHVIDRRKTPRRIPQ
jgi:hypothetical protein